MLYYLGGDGNFNNVTQIDTNNKFETKMLSPMKQGRGEHCALMMGQDTIIVTAGRIDMGNPFKSCE